MKPEKFLCEDAFVEAFDYDVLNNGTIVVIYEVESDMFSGDVRLTREEIDEAIKYAETLGFEDALNGLHDGIYLYDAASEQADPKKPDLKKLLFGTPPTQSKPTPKKPKP